MARRPKSGASSDWAFPRPPSPSVDVSRTTLSATAIRGFDSGFWVDFVVGPPVCSAAVWFKSFVFSFLPIRKVLVLFLVLVSGGFIHSSRRSYYLFFNYLFFNYL